jgi:predicted RNA-binding Zn-ribbon protein involved in translation (DUF1610 family)
MASTGTIAIASGSYECEHCRHVITLSAGDVAPKCPECGHEVGWRLRDPSGARPPATAPAPGPDLWAPSEDRA